MNIRKKIISLKVKLIRASSYLSIPITILNFGMIATMFLNDRGYEISLVIILSVISIIFLLIGILDRSLGFFEAEHEEIQNQSKMFRSFKKDLNEIKNLLKAKK